MDERAGAGEDVALGIKHLMAMIETGSVYAARSSGLILLIAARPVST
jgi:hypothetical protein